MNSIGKNANDAAGFISKMGPMSEPFEKADEVNQQKTLAALMNYLQDYEKPNGVLMGFGNWIVTAKKS